MAFFVRGGKAEHSLSLGSLIAKCALPLVPEFLRVARMLLSLPQVLKLHVVCLLRTTDRRHSV